MIEPAEKESKWFRHASSLRHQLWTDWGAGIWTPREFIDGLIIWEARGLDIRRKVLFFMSR